MANCPSLTPPPGLVVDRSPISDYLSRQQQLDTPVAQFARELSQLRATGEATTSRLIPLSLPNPGEQFAFEVDLDACTGCKACVAGCHSMNGLDEAETWRDVGTLFGAREDGQAYQQTVTTACHHCADPACLNGCPVLAYEKDPVTGIVRHLDDQCIGCQYCVLMCPYDVPKFSASLGIVRKCDMCHQRLAVGEAPACVAACPTEAIRISIVTTPTPAAPSNETFLAAAPSPALTLPTTRYHSKRGVPENAVAADAERPRIEHAHYPLVVMLTLTQFAVGGFFAAAVFDNWIVATVALVALLAGLGASTLHLGRPLGAWRAFLGLRRSWLSREIVLFGGLPPLAMAFVAERWEILPLAIPFLTPACLGLGLVAAFSSAMIYIDTRRHNWRAAMTLPEFGGSLILGFTAASLAVAPSLATGLVVLATLAALTVWDLHRTRLSLPATTAEGLRARLLRGPLARRRQSRLGCFALAAIATAASFDFPAIAWLVWPLCLGAEGLGRALYFQAVIAPKMPGGPTR